MSRWGVCHRITKEPVVCVWSAVDIEEIKRLGKRFKKLDLDKSGSLSVDEFMSLPELQQNPLVQRVIDIFDTDGNGEVDFKGRCPIPHLLPALLSFMIYPRAPCSQTRSFNVMTQHENE